MVSFQEYPAMVLFQEYPAMVPFQEYPAMVPFKQYPVMVPFKQYPAMVPFKQYPAMVPFKQYPAMHSTKGQIKPAYRHAVCEHVQRDAPYSHHAATHTTPTTLHIITKPPLLHHATSFT